MKGKLFYLLIGMVMNIGIMTAQTTKVRGVVFSEEDGEPVIGASVLVKGTNIGTVTGIDGTFEIDKVPSSAKTLIVSFVGTTSQDVTIASGVLRIVLKADLQALDEVLVVAYGSIKKSAFTGSAVVVSEEKLKTPAASFDKSMAGQVAGVQVVSSSGQPGSSSSFRIRGSGSLKASNEPLYVIDGVATTTTEYSTIADDQNSSSNILSSINPNDIESVTVLKDAAAAALYGSRAANGVVLITTKSGKGGKTKVSLNTQYSWASLAKAYETMNSAQYYRQLFSGYIDSGTSVDEANQQTQGAITHNPYNVANPLDANGQVASGAYTVVDTDWQDAVFRTAPTQDYNLSISGSSEKTSYFFSSGYTDQGGIAPAGDFKRYSGKANVNTQANSWLNAGLNVTFSHSIQNTTVAGSAGASPLNNALTFSNGVPVYVSDANGVPVLDASGNRQYNFTNPISRDFNPLAIPYMDTHRSKFYRLLASAYLDFTLLKGLDLKTVFAPDFVSTDEHRYWNKEHGNGPAYNGRIDKYHNVDLMYTSTNTLTYSNVFNNVHTVNAMAGMEYWQSAYETLYAGGRDLLGSMQELAAASGSFSPSSNTTKEVLISYFGRLEYAYSDKYNLSASLRTDGSSIFGSDTKWGTFWSVGASWRLKQEDFLKDIDAIDNLKLRLSYGTSGNKNGLERYASLGLWTVSSDYLYGSNAGAGHTQLANALLSWEKQGMFNVGVDFTFRKRFYGSVDYFYKTSDGLLYDYPLASSNGFKNITLNAAQTANSGFEFVLGADILTGEVKWNMSLNASVIKDKIRDLSGDDDVKMTAYQKIWSLGGSQYEFYMPTWAGVDSQTGNALWYVVGEDGNRTTTDVFGDATYEKQGRSTPNVYGGFTNTLSYKNFGLSVQLNYAVGGKLYDGLYATLMHDGAKMGTNLHIDALDAWTTPGKSANVPRFITNNASGSNSLSSRFLYDATNFKVKNVTLSYTLPKNLGAFSQVVSNAKVFGSVDNLFTWFTDDYRGYDDIDIYGVQGYSLYPSIPAPRTISIGANLTF
ncbi:Outer membrane cobalamin receptor protein, SusC/RagA family [Bacteroidales bacterium Barb6XT]|nr:Outer membrane cobalamin receptor protein, SusC/RagA family [Bacteroidales bacterium Barb6XT]